MSFFWDAAKAAFTCIIGKFTNVVEFFAVKYHRPALLSEMKTELEKYLPPALSTIIVPMLHYTKEWDLSDHLRLGTVCYARQWLYNKPQVRLLIRNEDQYPPTQTVTSSVIPSKQLTKLVLKNEPRSVVSMEKEWHVYGVREPDYQTKFFVSLNMPGDHYGKDLYEIHWIEEYGNDALLNKGPASFWNDNAEKRMTEPTGWPGIVTNDNGIKVDACSRLTEHVISYIESISAHPFQYFVTEDAREQKSAPVGLSGDMSGHLISWNPNTSSWYNWGAFNR
jgi:hypothetical protein